MMKLENNEPKRVLQIIRQMNVGGAETFIMNTYRNIDREKVQFDFLVNAEGTFDKEIKDLGGNIFYMEYITDLGQINYKRKLKEFFYNHNYNIVHSHINQVSGIILETAKECGIKYRIAHSHNTRNANNFFIKVYKRYLQSKINKNANILLACGKEAAKWLYKSKSNEAVIINNGIDIDKFLFSKDKRNKIRKELNILENTTVLGHIGRFSKQKNHIFLIKIFKQYLKENPNSVLLLIGDGKLIKKIENRVKKYKIEDNVKFLGTRKDVYNIYSGFDYFVFPSLFEGLSLSMIEAQISGLPVFASDTIDKNSDISNNVKWLNLKSNPQKWSREILKTPVERQPVKATQYDIKNVAKKMQELYSKLT